MGIRQPPRLPLPTRVSRMNFPRASTAPSRRSGSLRRPVAGVAANTAPDDLEDIVGVGPKLNALLIERGITTFRQVAVMTDDEVDLLDDSLPDFNGRVRRENWVRQAGELHLAKYGSAAVR